MCDCDACYFLNFIAPNHAELRMIWALHQLILICYLPPYRVGKTALITRFVRPEAVRKIELPKSN